jgi:RNA polymerase sigma factor (sigma-70 family)
VFAGWTDRELLQIVRAGEYRAFGELYRRYAHDAHRFARSLVRPEDVDDVVSESFAKVLHALQAGNGPDDHPVRYLMVTVRTTAVGLHAQRARRTALHRRYAPGLRAQEGDPGLRDELLLEAFASLSPRRRKVIWWSEIEGLSALEIGQRLGVTAGAAAALAYRARQALRTAYLEADRQG